MRTAEPGPCRATTGTAARHRRRFQAPSSANLQGGSADCLRCSAGSPHPPEVLIMPVTPDSRRSFLKAAAGAAGAAALGDAPAARGGGGDALIAYVGTYSSPLHNTP